MSKKNIILTGYRASGKSLMGSLLAQELNWLFFDTDAILGKRLGGSIQEIVRRHGWDVFRCAERALLVELASMKHVVVATGGGAIEHQAEWHNLRPHAHVIWLDADPATLYARMHSDVHTEMQRPPLTNKSSFAEIEEVMAKRRPLYQSGSDLRVDSGNRTPDEVLDILRRYVQQYIHQ